MRDTKKKSFAKWATHSLVGHVVLFQLFWSVPMLSVFLALDYYDDTLTLGWALYTMFVVSLSGLVLAILFWYTVSLPLIKQRRKGP